MPVSLRLPPDIESKISEYAARQGLTKSAVILRSVREFLSRNAMPSAYQIYQDVMERSAASPLPDRTAQESRPHKIAFRQAMQIKHAGRSARASRALKAKTVRRKAA